MKLGVEIAFHATTIVSWYWACSIHEIFHQSLWKLMDMIRWEMLAKLRRINEKLLQYAASVGKTNIPCSTTSDLHSTLHHGLHSSGINASRASFFLQRLCALSYFNVFAIGYRLDVKWRLLLHLFSYELEFNNIHSAVSVRPHFGTLDIRCSARFTQPLFALSTPY